MACSSSSLGVFKTPVAVADATRSAAGPTSDAKPTAAGQPPYYEPLIGRPLTRIELCADDVNEVAVMQPSTN